jgi:hypothetical protein
LIRPWCLGALVVSMRSSKDQRRHSNNSNTFTYGPYAIALEMVETRELTSVATPVLCQVGYEPIKDNLISSVKTAP